MVENELSLLDFLYKKLNFDFLSDLSFRVPSHSREMAEIIAKIPEEDYSLLTWNDALNYLVHESAQTSKKQAKELLIYRLQNFSKPCC